VNSINDKNDGYLKYAGSGFKDTTRIALSSPELWRDISLLNRDNLIALIERLEKNLDVIVSMMRDADAAGLEQEFSKAQSLRKKIE